MHDVLKVLYSFITLLVVHDCSRYSPLRENYFTNLITNKNMEQEQQQNTVIFNGDNSEFTLLVYFKTGYTKGMKFHSGKQETRRFNGQDIRDLRYALNRLVFLVEKKFEDKYKTAMIYHNPSGTEIMKYAYGNLKSKEPYKWSYTPTGDCLFALSDKRMSGDELREGMKKMHEQMQFKV